MSPDRMRRVDEAMREVLSDALGRDLKDPRVGFVTVTAVETSPDLRHARVYVSVLGTDAEREASLEGLRSAHGFLQRRIAAELRLKNTPQLVFEEEEYRLGKMAEEILALRQENERLREAAPKQED